MKRLHVHVSVDDLRHSVGSSKAAASQRSSSRSRVIAPRCGARANARWLTTSLTAIARLLGARRRPNRRPIG